MLITARAVSVSDRGIMPDQAAVPLPVGPAPLEPWQRQVIRSNARSGRLIVTTANGGFELFLRNWLAGLRALDLHEFVVVALDQQIWRLLDVLGLRSHALHLGTLQPHVNASSSWYDDDYRKLMGTQPSRLLRILTAGWFDVLISDVDVAWVRSPWPTLYSPARAHCQLQGMAAHQDGSHRRLERAARGDAARGDAARGRSGSDEEVHVRQPHPQANCDQCVNAGFFFLRRGQATRRTMGRWAHMLRAQHSIDHNQKWLNVRRM